ncbi:hypothetical protein ACE1OC_39660 [Streptomyces sp. DSM 116496]|uniref:hypothetical protein n=1 Tax=Streptomyces stoeckheimensis TaxID=3344656 RepID=UPI0038B2F78F
MSGLPGCRAAGLPGCRAAGLAAEAEQIALTLTDPYEQVGALAGVARAVAAAGDHERAERIARSRTTPQEQAWALIDVAQVVGPPHAGRLLGMAFALGLWRTPLPALATPYPQAAIRIADAVYANDGSAGLLEERTHVTETDRPTTLQARARLAYETGTAGDPAGAATIQEELLDACLRMLAPSTPTPSRRWASWPTGSTKPEMTRAPQQRGRSF